MRANGAGPDDAAARRGTGGKPGEARAAPGTTVVDRLPHDVHRLPTDIPFPLPPANVTYLEGAAPALVDCGIKTEEGYRSLEREAERAGVRLDRVERILITHAHLDHAGNAQRLAERIGAEVSIHADDADVLRHWDQVQEARNHAYDEGLVLAGLPEGVRERLGRRGRDVDAMMDAVPDVKRVQDGATIPAGDRELKVTHTPGHTPGSAIFWDPEDGFAATGDTILQWITPNALQIREEEQGALARYMETLSRLRGQPLDVMVPGHGPAFRGLDATIARCFELYHARRERLLSYLSEADGGDRADRAWMTAWDLVCKEWPGDTDRVAFLGTSEVLGHLGILVEEEIVEQHVGDAERGHASTYRLVKRR